MRTPSRAKRLRSARGRPRSAIKASPDAEDLGTPELILKRSLRLTAEPIDVCLERALISAEEHRAALHFRWLHTLRYGAAGVSSRCWLEPHGRDLAAAQTEDSHWRAQREQDYHRAITELAAQGHDALLIPCLIHNEWPRFLKSCGHTLPISSSAERDLTRFQTAIAHLAKHFGFVR